MTRIGPRELYEAEELLSEVASWSEKEVAALPRFYRQKADAYRQLPNPGDG